MSVAGREERQGRRGQPAELEGTRPAASEAAPGGRGIPEGSLVMPSAMEALVAVGPGGEFVRGVFADGHGGLVGEDLPLGWWQVREEGVEGREGVGLVVQAAWTAALDWLVEQARRLGELARLAAPGEHVYARPWRVEDMPPLAAKHGAGGQSASWAGPGESALGQEAMSNEPDTEAVAHLAAHPRLARPSWLFADDARARGRDRREQGHGLRARRGAHQKGSVGARAQQGSLFVDR